MPRRSVPSQQVSRKRVPQYVRMPLRPARDAARFTMRELARTERHVPFARLVLAKSTNFRSLACASSRDILDTRPSHFQRGRRGRRLWDIRSTRRATTRQTHLCWASPW